MDDGSVCVSRGVVKRRVAELVADLEAGAHGGEVGRLLEHQLDPGRVPVPRQLHSPNLLFTLIIAGWKVEPGEGKGGAAHQARFVPAIS